MTDKTAAEKARVKPGTRIALIDPVATVVDSVGLPEPVFVDVPDAQLVFLFVRTRAELDSGMPKAISELGSDAQLWVFFRKGSRAAGLDMSRDDVWTVAEREGLRPLGIISVDDTWAVFRLRR